jgi:hypothetical protein
METGASNPDLFQRTKSLSAKRATQLHLSVLLMRGELSFCATTIDSGVVECFGQCNLTTGAEANGLDDLISITGSEFQSASLAVGGTRFTLVPDHLFSKERQAEFLQFSYGEAIGSTESEVIGESDIRVIFEIEKEQIEPIQKAIPNIRLHCNSGLFVQCLRRAHRFSETHILHVDAHDAFIDCYVLKGHELLLCNGFNVENHNDILYHSMNVIQQLSLDPQNLEVNVSGAAIKDGKLIKLLSRYIEKVNVASKSSSSAISPELKNISPAQINALLNQYACAL